MGTLEIFRFEELLEEFDVYVKKEISRIMSWKQFLNAAYPKKMALEESHKHIIFRSHRWMGLRFGYVFYKLGMSANFISICRILMSIISLYFISLAKRGSVWMPLTGAFLLYGQNILDYADGVVARASGKTSPFGKALDEIVNAASRGSILVLTASFTGNIFVIVLSAFSAFILINFREALENEIIRDTKLKVVKPFYRVILSIQFMLFILPLLIVLNNILNLNLILLSYILTLFYTTIAMTWLLLCFRKRNN